MDILFFLKERTAFIRSFYETAAEPFRETIRKIEAKEPPYRPPPYYDDDEPPFLDQWIDADTALEVLGRACVSMLSATLHLYFSTWEEELRLAWDTPSERNKTFKNGWLQGYKLAFGEALKLPWDDCPANFEILEQVVLARNRDQHPDSITMLGVTFSPSDRAKHPKPFFVRDSEKPILDDPEWATSEWLTPFLHVSREGLFASIEQVDLLAGWLEEKMFAAKYRR